VKTAFVLGGGGVLGAHEVGMLQALAEAGIVPDAVVGTSIGAINGAFVAADPGGAAGLLAELWQGPGLQQAFSGNLLGRATTLAKSRTNLHAIEPLRAMLERGLPVRTFAELELPFHCVAASIERASAHWFSSGPLAPAVLASCAVPGLLPPVEVDGEHFFDGGLVHSIPVGRAVELGCRNIYVLQVGRIESPLAPPKRLWEVGLVAFEIARRHRFHEEMAALPDDVPVHVLPSGATSKAPELSQLRYRGKTDVGVNIERAYAASASYLAELA
jgi:NTE family protein